MRLVIVVLLLAPLIAATDLAAAEKKTDPWAGIVPVVPPEPAPGAHVATVVDPKATPDKVADAATIAAALQKLRLPRGWEKVEIVAAAGRDYALTLWYHDLADPSRAETEADTRRLVRAVLTALVSAGRSPSDERINVFVSAMRHMTGETGKKLVNWYGNAAYDYNTDSIGYDECEGKGWISPC